MHQLPIVNLVLRHHPVHTQRLTQWPVRYSDTTQYTATTNVHCRNDTPLLACTHVVNSDGHMQGIGITVPGSGITISKTGVRGVDSFGMLCSAHDIGWSHKADGVLVIMPDDAQPGDACPAHPPKVCSIHLTTVLFFCAASNCMQNMSTRIALLRHS